MYVPTYHFKIRVRALLGLILRYFDLVKIMIINAMINHNFNDNHILDSLKIIILIYP